MARCPKLRCILSLLDLLGSGPTRRGEGKRERRASRHPHSLRRSGHSPTNHHRLLFPTLHAVQQNTSFHFAQVNGLPGIEPNYVL